MENELISTHALGIFEEVRASSNVRRKVMKLYRLGLVVLVVLLVTFVFFKDEIQSKVLFSITF